MILTSKSKYRFHSLSLGGSEIGAGRFGRIIPGRNFLMAGQFNHK